MFIAIVDAGVYTGTEIVEPLLAISLRWCQIDSPIATWEASTLVGAVSNGILFRCKRYITSEELV